MQATKLIYRCIILFRKSSLSKPPSSTESECTTQKRLRQEIRSKWDFLFVVYSSVELKDWVQRCFPFELWRIDFCTAVDRNRCSSISFGFVWKSRNVLRHRSGLIETERHSIIFVSIKKHFKIWNFISQISRNWWFISIEINWSVACASCHNSI